MASRLLSFRASDSIQQKRVVDVLLMAALADGALGQDTLDRIGRALATHPELSGISWEWVVARADELALDAPLFSDVRRELVEQLSDPDRRRLAISLAAKIVGAGRKLSEEERAILHDLSLSFDLTAELDLLLAPGEAGGGYLRCASNDPHNPKAPSFFDAMAKAKTDDEVRLYTYKLYAIRRIMDDLFPGSELVSLGEIIRLGSHEARVDAVVHLADAGQCLIRCLADGEAMHPDEHRALASVAGELKELSFLVIAHQSSISPMDQAFLDGLDATRLRVEKVDIWEAVT